MRWIVRQYWGPGSGLHGPDEDLSGEEPVEGDDAEEAAEAFMERIEKRGDLSEWINGSDIELLARAEDGIDHLVIVTVDWDPCFYAHTKGPRT